jgi:magnesium-protoporphyrin O-methyltransferase
MTNLATYGRTRDRVEDYFDRTATRTWEALTSDAPVSKIRQTVREGRDRMRAVMLSRLPANLSGARVLDAGCGAGQMTAELAARGATIVACDISPRLIDIARARLSDDQKKRVTFHAGDMLSPELGSFDYVIAMDSLIYYGVPDITSALSKLASRTEHAVVFTVAPRTPFLMAFWGMGKLFPRSDRSPTMVPHAGTTLARHLKGDLNTVERVSRGFYISQCLEYQP